MKSTIPEAALKQHVALVAMTGGGKSYLARGIVESLLDDKRRVCIIDYTGVWYGLRSTASGKRAAYPVVIFGGEHADVPLNEHAGPSLAKLVASGNRPCIIDVDGMTVGAQQRFVTAFLEELYRVNSKPLHLVIEEIDEFAPQTGAPGAERMIGAVCRIFQRGRRKGFRAIAITQRPANVHKRVLTQCRTLIALQLNAPQDRGAILDWIRGHADLETGKKVVDDLPKLETGQGYVWAPQQKILEKVTFPKIKTFDSMRAPEDGEDPEPASWAQVDLEGIKTELADAVKEAEANDPKLLKAELAKAKAELVALKKAAEKPAAAKASTPPAPDTRAIDDARRNGFFLGRDCTLTEFRAIGDLLSAHVEGTTQVRDRFRAAMKKGERQAPPTPAGRPRQQTPAPAPASAAPARLPRSPRAPGTSMPKSERAILTVLAQRSPKSSSRSQLAILSGYSVTSSTFANAMSSLRVAGYLNGRGDDNEPTQAGLEALGAYEPLPTGPELVRWWQSRLAKSEREFLAFLVSRYPNVVSKVELAEATGYSQTSSTFANALSKLNTLELIIRQHGGDIRASETLFE